MAGPINETENVVWQTRRRAQTAYEDALAGALEAILGEGSHTLGDIVTQLNARGVRTESGESWTEANFVSEMHRLGA